MIHNSTSDPVLIKKISLKIWSLRDEIETRLQEKLAASPEAEINIDEFRNQFIKKNSTTDNVLPMNGGDIDGEDAMARAMAGEDVEIPETSSTVTAIDANIINVEFNPPGIPEEKIYNGKTVLAEISMEKMFFFSNKPFTEGQSIVIHFCIPKMFLMNADVLYCRTYNMQSRIISKNKYDYRVLVKFTFLQEGERALLRQFIQSIEPDLSKIDKKQKPKDDSDADLSALDDLGL